MLEREITRCRATLFQLYPLVTVTGPRQSGKTTLCRATFPDLDYVNLEAPDQRDFAESDPRGFLARFNDGAIMDEVRHVPALMSYLQVIADEKGRNGLFVLTGSEQFRLSGAISQSLAGRTALLRLLPFSLTERQRAGASDAMDDILYTGFYPRIIDQELNPTQALDYFETYVERDVRRLGAIRNLSNFRLSGYARDAWASWSISVALGADTGVSHTTARAWLTVLEASYIIFPLLPYHAHIRKRLVKSPKFYFCDVGLAAYLLGIENAAQIATHPLRGALFENAVIAEVLKHRFNRGNQPNLSFFRDARGLACDLFYVTARGIAAFEVKSGATISSEYFRSLHRVAHLVPNITSKTVVYGGTGRQSRSDGEVITLADLEGTLEMLAVQHEITAFVEDNKGLVPDVSDVKALDSVYARYIRPTLEGLASVLEPLAVLFRSVRRSSHVHFIARQTQSPSLLEASHWEQTKSQYIVVDGLQLSPDRPLELKHTCLFSDYRGQGHAGFDVMFVIAWRLDGASLAPSVALDGRPIPGLKACIAYAQLDDRNTAVDRTIAEIAGHILRRIGDRSQDSGNGV